MAYTPAGDLYSFTVRLPQSGRHCGFDYSGQPQWAMANLSPQLQTALAQFAAQPGVTPTQKARLRAAVASNARLLEQRDQDASQ
jgi:hypothetical protein